MIHKGGYCYRDPFYRLLQRGFLINNHGSGAREQGSRLQSAIG